MNNANREGSRMMYSVSPELEKEIREDEREKHRQELGEKVFMAQRKHRDFLNVTGLSDYWVGQRQGFNEAMSYVLHNLLKEEK